jgi:hypothetical protein
MFHPTNGQTGIDPGNVEKSYVYNGQGTQEDPFVVEYQKDDPENPMNWPAITYVDDDIFPTNSKLTLRVRKWFITAIVTWSVFGVTFTSSAYSESSNEVIDEFNTSTEVFIVGVSIFVLGFAIGPAVWGPLVSTLSRPFWAFFDQRSNDHYLL